MRKHLSSLLIVAFALSFSSCSIQKRRYNTGFHLDWFSASKAEQKKDKSEPPSKAHEFTAVESQLESASLAAVQLESDQAPRIVMPLEIDDESSPLQNIKTKVKPIPAFKAGVKQVFKEKARPKPDGRSQMLKGIMYMVIGGIVFLFLNTIVGIILGILGFFLFLIGIGNLGRRDEEEQPVAAPPKDEERPEYQDVVYLKNGSIIRGMIIEQIPNKSIKIQTKDGNVFVFEMDEIEKITKELAK